IFDNAQDMGMMAKGGSLSSLSEGDQDQLKKLHDINAYLKKYIETNERNPFDLKVKDFKKQVKVNNRLIKDIKDKYNQKPEEKLPDFKTMIIDGEEQEVRILRQIDKSVYVEYENGTTEFVTKNRINNWDDLSKMAKGGKLAPVKKEKLIKAVAKQYEGKKVKPEYQEKYGKRYSKKEAKSVGYAIANTVEKMKKENKMPLKQNKYSNLLPGF
ncbi:MAG: hypothetical protein AAB877_02270, partial [Patescibacteria group bacterium]